MKKSICILLILAMMLPLCGCGGKKPAETAAPAEPAAEKPAAAAQPAAEKPAAADEPAAAAEAPEAAKPQQEESAAAPVNPAALPAEEGFAVPACGFTYVYPEEYRNADGVIRMMEQGITKDSATLELVYILVPKEERDAFAEFEKSLGDEGLTLPALFQKGYMAFTLFMVYADRADAATAKLIANDMGTNAASEDMIYVGQTQASADWYCSVMRLLPMEKEADSFRETMGDAYDEYMSFARNKELVLSGFQKN